MRRIEQGRGLPRRELAEVVVENYTSSYAQKTTPQILGQIEAPFLEIDPLTHEINHS